MSTGTRFKKFINNLLLTTPQITDGTTKHKGVINCLNRHYYGYPSETLHGLLVGSWGKETQIGPPRDIDLLFTLPTSVRDRFYARTGNRQSQLLQEVKGVLSATYSSTKVRGDGQVVVVPFVSFPVEVVPAFKLDSGRYFICDTNNEGRYRVIDPNADIKQVQDSNRDTSGNTRDLIRMMKRWQAYKSVPMKSFWLELLAVEFLRGWMYAGKSAEYYDWMTRDFFEFLVGKAGCCVFKPGINEAVGLGTAWKSKAESAYDWAKTACSYETAKHISPACTMWRIIFGGDYPEGD